MTIIEYYSQAASNYNLSQLSTEELQSITGQRRIRKSTKKISNPIGRYKDLITCTWKSNYSKTQLINLI